MVNFKKAGIFNKFKSGVNGELKEVGVFNWFKNGELKKAGVFTWFTGKNGENGELKQARVLE